MLGAHWSAFSGGSPSGEGGGNVTVPNVLLMSRADAEAALGRIGLQVDVTPDRTCGSTIDYNGKKTVVELGHVCTQSPWAGQATSMRIKVYLKIQDENPWGGDLGGTRGRWFLMPDVRGMPIDKARAIVRDKGFVSKEIQIAYTDDCAANIVCKSLPEELSRTDTTSDKLFYVGRPPEPSPEHSGKPDDRGRPDDRGKPDDRSMPDDKGTPGDKKSTKPPTNPGDMF